MNDEGRAEGQRHSASRAAKLTPADKEDVEQVIDAIGGGRSRAAAEAGADPCR